MEEPIQVEDLRRFGIPDDVPQISERDRIISFTAAGLLLIVAPIACGGAVIVIGAQAVLRALGGGE